MTDRVYQEKERKKERATKDQVRSIRDMNAVDAINWEDDLTNSHTSDPT